MGTWTVNGEAWTDAAIEALIRRLDVDDWRERAADIHRDMPGWVLEGRITEERAERLTDAIQARQDRTTQAAERKVEFRTQRITAADGSKKNAKAGRIGCLVTPMVDEMRPAPPSPPSVVPKIRAGVRGPSRHTPEERAVRADRRLDQAHMTGAPYQAVTGLKVATRAVFSIIVLDCRTTAAGACERTVARIAGAAACSERAVQYAVRKLAERGLVAVEERRGRPNRITITSERVKTWGRRAERFRSILLDEEISSREEEKIKAPPRGANACVTPDEDASQIAQEDRESVPAKLGAEQAPRASTGQGTNPGGIRAAWDLMLDRANAMVAAAERSRNRDREHDPRVTRPTLP